MLKLDFDNTILPFILSMRVFHPANLLFILSMIYWKSTWVSLRLRIGKLMYFLKQPHFSDIENCRTFIGIWATAIHGKNDFGFHMINFLTRALAEVIENWVNGPTVGRVGFWNRVRSSVKKRYDILGPLEEMAIGF